MNGRPPFHLPDRNTPVAVVAASGRVPVYGKERADQGRGGTARPGHHPHEFMSIRRPCGHAFPSVIRSTGPVIARVVLSSPGKRNGRSGLGLIDAVYGIDPFGSGPFLRQGKDFRCISPDHTDGKFTDESFGRFGTESGGPGSHRVENNGDFEFVGLFTGNKHGIHP